MYDHLIVGVSSQACLFEWPLVSTCKLPAYFVPALAIPMRLKLCWHPSSCFDSIGALPIARLLNSHAKLLLHWLLNRAVCYLLCLGWNIVLLGDLDLTPAVTVAESDYFAIVRLFVGPRLEFISFHKPCTTAMLHLNKYFELQQLAYWVWNQVFFCKVLIHACIIICGKNRTTGNTHTRSRLLDNERVVFIGYGY